MEAPITLRRGGLVRPKCNSDTSACRGGRKPCPTPDACVTTEDDIHAPARGIVTAVAIVGGIAAIVIGGPALWHAIAHLIR